MHLQRPNVRGDVAKRFSFRLFVNTRNEPSRLPAANRLPLDETAMEVPKSDKRVCERSTLRLRRFHSCTVLSAPVDATRPFRMS